MDRRIFDILVAGKTMLHRIKHELKQGKTLMTFTTLQAAGQAFGMVAPLVVAKAFSAELFGSYSLSKMVVFFFGAFLVSSTQAPFIIFANQERARSGKINQAFTAQCVFLALSLFIFAVLAVSFRTYIIQFAGIDRGDLLCVALAFVGIALKAFMSNLFMGMGQRVKNSLVELAFGSFTLGLILLFYLTGTMTLRAIFLTYLASAVFVSAIFVWSIDWSQLLPLSVDKQRFKDMLNFTKWIMFGATAIYFVNWGDYVVLRYYKSMGDIGAYGLGYQIFKGAVTLILVVNAYFLPFVSQHITDSVKMRDYLFGKRPKIFLVGIGFIVLLFVLVPYLLNIYDKDYEESSVVFRVLLVGCIPILYTVFYVPILNTMGKYRFHQTVNFFHVVLNLVLDVLLVPVMGLLGAAVATTAAYFCQAATFEVYFRLRLRRLLW
ncbi:MAG: polysaccharide biosynthesis C-terminal domain-containing protein [Sedimentisphaerales bacterium]|nr:polysaccharide biosynthesis C-terminal domain-containing protein [Sedimentisphaerales bacterium]